MRAELERDDPAVDWLLGSSEPSIRRMARRDLLGERGPEDDRAVLDGPIVRTLLAGQTAGGGFGGHSYSKWGGAHWRLVSLVELEAPASDPRVAAAAERVLSWLASPAHRRAGKEVGGLMRVCASLEGNGLAACCRLGLAGEPRVELLARTLAGWQWPDGGWNCDQRASGRRSSFHETLPPAWGLHEYWAATGAEWARDAARRAAELFLEHRLFRSLRTGEVIDRRFVALHYPPYWHYDILQALLVLSRMGLASDPRAADALDVVERRRLPDGRWRPGGYWWRHGGRGSGPLEVVDWGRDGPCEMLTLNALRCLRAAGR